MLKGVSDTGERTEEKAALAPATTVDFVPFMHLCYLSMDYI